jgi:hypothetical protein
MARFEESSHHHQVHELHRPQGHGYVDQKYGKGNRSPISASVPQVEQGAMPGMDGAGSPGIPQAGMGAGPTGSM